MLDTALFSASEILDATLTLVALEEANLRDEDEGLETSPKAESALMAATDHLEGLLKLCLRTQQSELLTDALEVLHDTGQVTACEFLEGAVELAACSARDEDGRLLEMVLVPVVVSKEACHLHLTTQQCRDIAQAYRNHDPARVYSEVRVGRRLHDPAEIYSLSYHEVFALNGADSLDLRHIVSRSTQEFNHPLWHPELRFLAIHLESEPQALAQWLSGASAEQAAPEDWGSLEDPREMDDAQEGVRVALRELATDIGHILAVAYGTPLLCGVPDNLYAARQEGMLMYAHKVARLSIERQLEEQSNEPARMLVTFHAHEVNGDDSDVSQARVAVLDENGVLIAGHVIESNDWLPAKGVSELLRVICESLGLVTINQANQIIEILDEAIEPFFCTGEDWAQLPAQTLRLEQEIIA